MTAGLVSRFIIAPLDVIKIRLQLQTQSLKSRGIVPPRSLLTTPPPYQLGPQAPAAAAAAGIPYHRSAWAAARHIVATEGVTALWKGNVPAEVMYVAYSGVQFVTYRATAAALHSAAEVFAGSARRGMGNGSGSGSGSGPSPRPAALPHWVESFVAGSMAGAAATAATYPLDLLRTRFAAQGNSVGVDRAYANLRVAVRDIFRDEGWRGYFRGLSAGLGQIVPFMGLFFALYETLRPAARKLDFLPFGSADGAAGAVASVIAKTAVFPLDLVRKRLQVQGPTRGLYAHRYSVPVYGRGIAKIIAAIVREEGVRGLYRGLAISLVKSAPTSAVTMWTYERTLAFLVAWEKRRLARAVEREREL